MGAAAGDGGDADGAQGAGRLPTAAVRTPVGLLRRLHHPRRQRWNYAGSPASSDRRADAVVVDQGANDGAYGAEEFRATYRAYLIRLRQAAPYVRVLAMRPLNGAHAADVSAVVAELADPRTEFVDATGWVSAEAGDLDDAVHPNAQGHRKVAERLIALLSGGL